MDDFNDDDTVLDVAGAEALVEKYLAEARTEEARGRLEDVRVYAGGSIVEPGYDPIDDSVVCTGNWNAVTRWDEAAGKFVTVDDTPARLGEALEAGGAELYWGDEWDSCSSCGGLFRTKPDSYHWTPYYEISDCEVFCGDCVKKNVADHLAGLEGDHTRCLSVDDIDPTEHGYELVEGDYEFGWHPGQDVRPARVAEALRAQGLERFLFRLDSVSQFDRSFSVYLHSSEADRLDREAFARANKSGPPLADALERAMKGLPPAEEGTVQLVRIDPETGESSVRSVPADEFLRGLADDREEGTL